MIASAGAWLKLWRTGLKNFISILTLIAYWSYAPPTLVAVTLGHLLGTVKCVRSGSCSRQLIATNFIVSATPRALLSFLRRPFAGPAQWGRGALAWVLP